MASVTARLSVLGESGYGEPEQDANSALTELDKGLRSGKIGEQCEAIVRFPRLFAKYPFPILINSAFLKLADVFRLGTNFLRLCVLKVTQQSHKHLDKILNVDEFVRRIYSVVHSNDPLARALTLRTLGSIAYIIPERKNVHHTIRVSLDSHDAVELEAAIFATEKFASCSKTFASNICEKVSQMIEGLATPVDMKLKLIPIFQYMHHDAQTAATVRKLCTDLLPIYPARQFVMVTLNTLTLLASASTIDIPEHVSLLIEYLGKDSRHLVKHLALKNMKLLAEKGAHLWSESNIEAIFDFALETPYKELKCAALTVLIALAKTVVAGKFSTFVGSPFQRLCSSSCYSVEISVATKAVELLTNVALCTYQEGHVEDEFDLFQEAVLAIESLLLTVSSSSVNTSVKHTLKSCLSCAVSLCEADPNISHLFVDSIGSLVTHSTGGQTSVVMCEALAAIANRKANVLSSLAPDLFAALRNSGGSDGPWEKQRLVMLSTLVFQAAKDQPGLATDVEQMVAGVVESVDPWTRYKVARQAARFGHHAAAARLFASLTSCMSSEHLHFWMVGLWEVFAGESCLVAASSPSSQADRIAVAVTHYMRGISALKSATTQSHTLQFQCEYARLRAEMLQVHAQLVHSCHSHKTAPPPAIAAAVATATRDELNKCGRIATQLRKSVKDFRAVGDLYGKLYQSYFDMDPVTLTNILVLQQSCNLVAYAIENVALSSQAIGLLGHDDDGMVSDMAFGLTKQHHTDTIEGQGMARASQRAFAIAQEVTAVQTELKPIAYEHVQAILEISQVLTQVPLCYPRFFFQSLQSTNIKLAISPQPRCLGEPVNVQSNSHLALKVEGIVQHGVRQGRFRNVKSVVISISSQLQNRQQPVNADVKMATNVDGVSANNMSQTVPPHNDYFNAQFLLAFPVPGLHVVVIDVAVLDEKGDLWKTGPRSVMTAKACDDPQKVGAGVSGSRPAFNVRY